MGKAIAVPYASYQDEPSRPYRRLIDVPDNKKERDAALKRFFVEHVNDCDIEDLTISTKRNEYGDITVAHEEGEVYLYLTFLEE